MDRSPTAASLVAHESVVIAHSSDLHIGLHRATPTSQDIDVLRTVLNTARHNGAQVVVLAGDVFDHNRLPLATIESAARVMADAAIPVVILPGNHDCLAANSVYRRGGLADPDNVYVFGITHEHILFEQFGLALWGRPHMDHADMSPLRDAPARQLPRQVAVAHGHWLETGGDAHRSWLIRNEEIEAVDADYIALGHWDRNIAAGEGARRAHYSGSPDLARTINLARFSNGAPVEVTRAALITPFESHVLSDGEESPVFV